jgi:sugar phosphate isomerase/epimerase
MAGVTRREFLNSAGGASAALAFMAANGVKLNANPLGLPIGSQMWPHRAPIGTEGYAGLAGVLKNMKSIGIDIVEMISPSYLNGKPQETGEFKALTDGKQVRKVLDDHGIKSPSAHFRGVRGAGNLPVLIEWGNAIGMTHMNMASMGGQTVNGVTSLEMVKRTCDEYNKIGAITKKSGLQLMTHNEGFENSRLPDGRLTYPVLLEHLDPDLVKMQFQMSSMRNIGDPVMYFTMYPGRFESAHLQGVDATAGMNVPGPGRLTARPPMPTAEWVAQQNAMKGQEGRGRTGGNAAAPAPAGAAGGRAGAPAGGRAGAPAGTTAPAAGGGGGGLALGEDSVDWVAVFRAGKIGGLKHAFVEQNWDLTVKSVAFLKSLNVP